MTRMAMPGVPYILVDGKVVEQPNDLLKEACIMAEENLKTCCFHVKNVSKC